ncbi:MAG: hypothetical protein IKX21_06850 [Deltaproteobacteria bacterium]|nr:hypothetical protein [Deltaproteobacteria bacterium]
MKPQHLEDISGYVDAAGHYHTHNDKTTDSWNAEAPRILHTAQARRLFAEAIRAGILREVWATDEHGQAAYLGLDRAGTITRAQLAYWCKKASTYLGIDRGLTTNWKPFEEVLAFGQGLKLTLHDIYYNQKIADGIRQEYTRPIDEFFATLDTSTNEQAPTNEQ